jgi:hypothetical protein
MAKVKIKKKVIGGKSDNIGSMFGQMLGTEDNININICYPKYVKLKEYMLSTIKSLHLLTQFPTFKLQIYGQEFDEAIDEINNFIVKSSEQIKELFKIDFSDYEWNLTLLTPEQRKQFETAYADIKSCELKNTLIVMCDQLIPYKKYIENKDALSYKFILNMPGTSFSPIPFTRLNFKSLVTKIYTENGNSMSFEMSPKQKETNEKLLNLLMLYINKIYELTYNFYKTVMEPDIDVDEFASTIINSLQDIKKLPELHRCDKAFKALEESVGMLKTNFSGYYKDMVTSQNSGMIMENFILDVSKNQKNDPQVLGQFKTIIKFYRKHAQGKIKDPKLKMIFEKLNTTYQDVKGSNDDNIKKAQNGEFDDDSDDDLTLKDEDEGETKEPKEPAKLTKTEKEQAIREKNSKLSVDELVNNISKDRKK